MYIVADVHIVLLEAGKYFEDDETQLYTASNLYHMLYKTLSVI